MAENFQRAEKLLYAFPVNLMRLNETVFSLKALRAETDCHAQNYEAPRSSAGTHSAPVESYNSRLEALEHSVARLRKEIEPVKNVRTFLELSNDERDIEMYCVMELYYFEKRKMEDVALHLQKSLSTLSRRRQELVGLVMREMECP